MLLADELRLQFDVPLAGVVGVAVTVTGGFVVGFVILVGFFVFVGFVVDCVWSFHPLNRKVQNPINQVIHDSKLQD